jgi:hypothetical protein
MHIFTKNCESIYGAPTFFPPNFILELATISDGSLLKLAVLKSIKAKVNGSVLYFSNEL